MIDEVDMKALLLGEGVVTKAVGKVLELFNIKSEESENANWDILVISDWDSCDIKKINNFTGLEKVIYLESLNKKDNYTPHPLTFLTELCVTYRIPLKSFSIVEFGRIINDIATKGEHGSDYLPPQFRPIPVIKGSNEILKTILNAEGCPQAFSEYLYNQRAYVEQRLHNYKGNAEEKEKIRKDIIYLDYLFSLLKVPQELSLKILIIENEPENKKLVEDLKELKEQFKGIK